jgi:hypothetical protein
MFLVQTLDCVHGLWLMEKELSYDAADDVDCGLGIRPSEIAVDEREGGSSIFRDVFLQVID